MQHHTTSFTKNKEKAKLNKQQAWYSHELFGEYCVGIRTHANAHFKRNFLHNFHVKCAPFALIDAFNRLARYFVGSVNSSYDSTLVRRVDFTLARKSWAWWTCNPWIFCCLPVGNRVFNRIVGCRDLRLMQQGIAHQCLVYMRWFNGIVGVRIHIRVRACVWSSVCSCDYARVVCFALSLLTCAPWCTWATLCNGVSQCVTVWDVQICVQHARVTWYLGDAGCGWNNMLVCGYKCMCVIKCAKNIRCTTCLIQMEWFDLIVTLLNTTDQLWENLIATLLSVVRDIHVDNILSIQLFPCW